MKALGKGSISSRVKIVLDIARVVLWVVAAALAALIVVYTVLWALVVAGLMDRSALAGFEGNIRFADQDVGGDHGWPAAIPALLAGVITVGGGLIIVGRLRKLFAGFSSGEPFRREYATHLRVIWITMMVMELSRYALLALMGGLLATFGDPVDTDATLRVQVNISAWLSIFVLIVLAEVFREGARLKEEQELTI
jgi:Protein of unknown function (DUF2975)